MSLVLNKRCGLNNKNRLHQKLLHLQSMLLRTSNIPEEKRELWHFHFVKRFKNMMNLCYLPKIIAMTIPSTKNIIESTVDLCKISSSLRFRFNSMPNTKPTRVIIIKNIFFNCSHYSFWP